MNQIHKIYLASFLKNQTYFVPIMVLFFQDLGLNYSQIFWIFTIGSIFAFIIEIPTGIFADIYGKKKSLIISKGLIFISFLAFALAGDFWTLLLANLIYELGNGFRSGTETAYIYNYLTQTKGSPSYTIVKTNQKFYARISESIATAVGGFLAYHFGFNFVFFVAAAPAFINFVQTLTWHKLDECQAKTKKHINRAWLTTKESFAEILPNPEVKRIIINITIFTAIFFALGKFIQPYMKEAGIDLQYFGIIYSAFLIVSAFLVRYIVKVEDKFGGVKITNYVSIISFIPLFILGFGFSSAWGIVLMFSVMLIDYIRSPIVNTVFHQHVSSKNRSTTGSILELFKSAGNLIILPVIGYFADAYSVSAAIMILAGLVLLAGLMFWLQPQKNLPSEGRP